MCHIARVLLLVANKQLDVPAPNRAPVLLHCRTRVVCIGKHDIPLPGDPAIGPVSQQYAVLHWAVIFEEVEHVLLGRLVGKALEAEVSSVGSLAQSFPVVVSPVPEPPLPTYW